MKRIFTTALFAAGLFAATSTFAQTHKDTTLGQKVGSTAKKGWHATKKTASKVGNKTAEVTSKGASAVADQKVKDKVAPGGQAVYVDGKSRYYYVSKKGGHVYVKESALISKP